MFLTLTVAVLLILAVVGWGAWYARNKVYGPAGVATRSSAHTGGREEVKTLTPRSLAIGGLALGIPLILWIVVAALLGVQSIPPPEPALPELKAYPLNYRQVTKGDSRAEVATKLGEPVLVAVDTENLLPSSYGEQWLYPIRLSGWTSDSAVRAPLLKIQVDPEGYLAEWYFVHPVTGERLASSEAAVAANHWLDWHCGREWGPRVDLAQTLQVGVTRTDDVLALMGAHGIEGWATHHPEAIFVRPDPEHGGAVLTYPVDHPSALYIPAFYVIVQFDADGYVSHSSISGYCSRGKAL